MREGREREIEQRERERDRESRERERERERELESQRERETERAKKQISIRVNLFARADQMMFYDRQHVHLGDRHGACILQRDPQQEEWAQAARLTMENG